ncbi:LysR family transcriptional regulator [Acetobacter estunensis NRIC 0472]|uniref:LysR family transcriptional regulator n=1 Tax=Acetobacter estunensis TaxID=104097 RepID=A0A967B880_9PROT|nr:LysR family transcriptional regulator [Acetobacter estunensis]NHO54495.1 LysR family transcriptional regulator [Acetobacter estunensis]GBQ25437.1 LysR family transcriptional regulator [Acetobacter estunensis NRIC 0472]
MDRLATLDLFVRIVDRSSFSAAAADCGVSRPVATAAIKALEQRLDTRLLHRSTRHVRPTEEGAAYYRRCVAILADIEDADRSVSGAVAGLLRADVIGRLARMILLPALPDFLVRHPALTVHLGEGERFVDLVREGVDCVVRTGSLPDSGMIARSLGVMEEVTVASPAYLARHGTPVSPDDLEGHQMIGFVSSRTGQPVALEFTRGEEAIEVSLPARLLVGGVDTYAEAARLGFGLVQVPRYGFEDDLAKGTLIEVLPDFPPTPTPVSVLYPSNRQLSPRVRMFVDWLVEIIGSRFHQNADERPYAGAKAR